MKFCKRCVMPDTKPNLYFDEEGVCDACRSQERKNLDIDWNGRKAELLDIIKKHKKHPIYDCVIGVSGGKDSHFQVLTMLNLGLNPLCVCFEPTIPTKVGRKNLKNLNRLGVDIIHIKRDPNVYKKLAKAAFKRTGDNEWQNHLGIFSCVPRIAVNFGIPLIIWGESPQLEYGGPASSKDNNILDKSWLHRFGGLLGCSIEDMIGVDGLTKEDLYFYTYPSDEELKRVNVTGLFLGYYVKWDYKENLRIAKENGFSCSDRPVETTYENFENLDCYSNHLHDYIKYCKYGFGRATDNACIDIRLGYMDREQGVRLVNKYDGKPPKKAIKKYLEYSGFSADEFWEIVDSFTNKDIFKCDENGKFLRDIDGSLIRKDGTILK